MRDRFLIVVDMQRDFIDGSLGTAEARAIVPAAAERVRAARAEGYVVIATLDTHGEDYLETAEGKKLPVRHCVRDTEGWRLSPEIEDALADSPRVEKPTFGSVRLPELIRELAGGAEPRVIELIGLCTDICVVSNALLLKAHFPEAEVAVRRGCCAGVTPEKHEAALETMASCQIDIL
ncbi:MAG: cysteine hydrolase [Clostridia bacterium]|nr:cysteine hydrolase [Clostridia bacterium]